MELINLGDMQLILDKKNIRLFTSDNSHKYFCRFIFKNLLGNILLDITLSETDVAIFLENLYQFMEFNLPEMNVFFNSVYNQNMSSFGFKCSYEMKMTVVEYNPYSELLVERLSFQLGDNNHYDIIDFIKDIYCIFLSDIYDYIYLDPDFLC